MSDHASPPAPIASPKSRRLHDLDALRGFAMLLGIVLHAALAFFPSFWPVQDNTVGSAGPYDEILHAIHGFRMPLFFLLSGFFTSMLWRRRGLQSLIGHRLRRVALPLAIGVVTIVPLMNWVSERASASQFDDLVVAAFFQNEAAVDRLLDNGADPNESKGQVGDSPLHIAALAGNVDIAGLLLEAGADPFSLDDNGDTPLGWAFFSGSEEVADLLVEFGHPDFRPAGTEWRDLEGWGFGAEEAEELLGLDSWITSLHHLWFLWFLILLVGGFVIVAVGVDAYEGRRGGPGAGKWAGRVMWALIPVTLLPQLAMGDGGEIPVFGPDTSAGPVPIPHVLIYYAVFFAFGALVYGRENEEGELYVETLGRWWKILLPLTILIVLPLGLELTFGEAASWPAASIVQVVYAWAMIAALMGVFRAVLAKERRGVRYLSDSSYWLYLAHLPLIIAGQAWIREWDLPSGLKLTGLTVATTALLLLSYQLFIRYTPVGTMLNGKRTRPLRSVSQQA